MKQAKHLLSGFTVGILSLSALCLSANAAVSPHTYLVQNGAVKSVIVAPSAKVLERKPQVQRAIDELQYHIKRASGAKLQITTKTAAAKLPSGMGGMVRIIFEEGDETGEAEKYAVRSDGNTLTFVGDGRGPQSDALQWAVDYYLDAQLGVRWLWPGEVGTFVPPRTTIPLTDIDYQGQPKMLLRRLRTRFQARQRSKDVAQYLAYRQDKFAKGGTPLFLSDGEVTNLVNESRDWLTRFQMGERSPDNFGLRFGKWWDKYGKDHPEYFAVPPTGSQNQQPWPGPKYVKLRIGNPAIDEVIIAEWKAAGAPDRWSVPPNDGWGFDTSAASRAMDDPPNQDPNLIWHIDRDAAREGREINLTARYVKFWNRLIAKMRKINPNVTLGTYGYSTYRNPPFPGLKVDSSIAVQLVPRYWGEDFWQGWQEAGAHKLYLRPNWWYAGGVAPELPLHGQGNFFKYAQSHNMLGFDFDMLHGHWATQGAMYYTIARLSERPEMSVDEVLDEYTSAFGKAAPDIKKYFSYWEEFTAKAGYEAGSVPLGSKLQRPKGGLIAEIEEKHEMYTLLSRSRQWRVIPYLYTDDVINGGYAILNQATKDASGGDGFAAQRVQFLRDGLDHLKLTRDVIILGTMKKRSAAQNQRYQDLLAQLLDMRRKLTLKNVIWGEQLYADEKHRTAPTIGAAQMQAQHDIGLEYIKEKYTQVSARQNLENWIFKTDPQNDGLQRGFAKPDFDAKDWSAISPHDFWQSQGFNYHGAAWYRLQLPAVKVNRNEKVTLYFGAVDGDATIYLNGKKIGEHPLSDGWDTPFALDVTSAIRPTENILVAHVVKNDPDRPSGIHKGVALIVGTPRQEADMDAWDGEGI